MMQNITIRQMSGKIREWITRHNNMMGELILAVLTICLLIHSQFSFCQSDESFYISTTNRWLQGDAMIADEWQPAQFYTVILLPFLSIYKAVVPSLSGVILCFRILYLLWSGIVSIVFYRVLTKYTNRVSALMGTILLLVYSRANIAGPSYYNLCARFVQLAWVCMIERRSRWKQILSGFIYAVAVLCQPYLAFFVFLFMIPGIIHKRTRKTAGTVSVGIGAAAICFLTFLLSRASIYQIIDNIPYVVTDPQHMESLISKFIAIIQQHVGLMPFPLVLFILLLTVVYLVVKCYFQRETSWLVPVQVIILLITIKTPLLEIHNVACYSFYSCISIALIPTIIDSVVSRKDKELFLLYTVGICVAISFAFGSNTHIDAMTTGYCISSASGLMMLINRLRSETRARRMINISCAEILTVFCIVIIFISSATRFIGIYRDAPLNELTYWINVGPAKGLLTCEENKRQYDEIYETMMNLEHDESQSILHLPKTPWAYMCTNMRCAGPTTWTTLISSERILRYVELHDNRYPDYVVIYSENVGSYHTVPYNNHKEELHPSSMEMEGTFYELLQKEYRVEISNDYVTVYKKHMSA